MLPIPQYCCNVTDGSDGSCTSHLILTSALHWNETEVRKFLKREATNLQELKTSK